MNSEKCTSTLTPLASSNGRKAVRKAKKFSDSSSSPSRRKSLQLLQPVAGDQSQLVGSDGVIRLTNQVNKTPKRKFVCDGKSQPKKVFRPDGGKNFTIFEDGSSSSSSSSSQTPSAEQETIDMMTEAEPTGKYWEELAEERRVALEETLQENEKLFTENCELKEENSKLQVMADQAEYLADVVETLMQRMESTNETAPESKEDSSRNDDDRDTDHDDNVHVDDEEDEDDDEVFDRNDDPVHKHKDDMKDNDKVVEDLIAVEGEEDEV